MRFLIRKQRLEIALYSMQTDSIGHKPRENTIISLVEFWCARQVVLSHNGGSVLQKHQD